MAGFLSAARKWLDKAAQDLLLADRAMQSPRLPALACFHAQQAAEKTLKGAVAAAGVPDIPRVHSLLPLAGILEDRRQPLPFPPEQLASLDPYAVAARYPDEPEPSEQAAAQAIALAQEIYQWAERLVA